MTDTLNRDRAFSVLFDFYIESAPVKSEMPVSESARIDMHGRDWEIELAGKKRKTAHPQVVFTAKSGKLFNKVES